MNANEMMNLVHAKMVEAMTLLKAAYEKANVEAADAEAKERHAADVLARFEHMYPVFEGVPSFEADMDTAQEVYDKAWRKADLLRYNVDQIDSAMISLRDALDYIEDSWEYEAIGGYGEL